MRKINYATPAKYQPPKYIPPVYNQRNGHSWLGGFACAVGFLGLTMLVILKAKSAAIYAANPGKDADALGREFGPFGQIEHGIGIVSGLAVLTLIFALCALLIDTKGKRTLPFIALGLSLLQLMGWCCVSPA